MVKEEVFKAPAWIEPAVIQAVAGHFADLRVQYNRFLTTDLFQNTEWGRSSAEENIWIEVEESTSTLEKTA